jgi:hypothetical protein
MLFKTCDITQNIPSVSDQENNPKGIEASVLSASVESSLLCSDIDLSLTKSIGLLCPGKTTHYYSWGNFNLVRVIMHILKQTGPAHVFMTSYSFSQKSIESLNLRIRRKEILTFRVIVDNRVKTMSPLPFQMIMESFDYRCTSIHAKIALIWNEKWSVTILTSQNATDNPKMERGTIFTSKEIFEFDLKNLNDEFNRGTA